MGQLKSLEGHLHIDERLKKRYIETIDTEANAGYVRKVELNWVKTKTNCNGINHIILSKTHINLKKSEEYATHQQSIKA